MPNYIKYTTGTESNALKKGNFYIGTGDEAKGPTSQTGFYNGPTPGDYQYTVYVNQDNDIPLAYTARNDNELVTLTNTISGQSFTTINQCFAYYEGQSDKMCINKPIDGIVTDGLVLNLDAGNVISYPASGSTWGDISGNNNSGSLINGPIFDSRNGGSIVFDGTDDYVLINDGFTNLFKNKSYWSTSIWVKVISWGAGNDSYPVLVSIGSGQGAYTELYLEIGNDNGTTKFYFVYAGNSLNGNVEINLNEVYNFVYVKDGSTFKFYKNGTLISSAGDKNSISTTDGDIWLGRFKTGDFELNGNIYSTQIYNRALSADEVLQNYNAQKVRFEAIELVTDGLVLNLDAGNPNSYLSGSSGTTWTDISGEGNDGTLTNGASYTNGAIEFDGTNDLITTTLTSNTIFTSSFTVSCWFNADAIGSFPRIFNKANNGSTFEAGGFGSFFNDSNGTYQIYCRIDNNLIDTSAATFSLGVWNNLTTVFKNGEATVYLNGGSGITGTNASAQLSDITTSDDFVIGNIHGANRPFDGKIAITMIYSKELSQAENTQNFNALRGRYGI